MIHLGDITKINGAAAPTVEIIIGGSPCQDLSVAGKREGLSGERSGLFMEQIRIIKEMREKSAESGADVIIPRFMVWENVPGAFSSNKGEDFRIVLEETARVVDEGAVIPRPPAKWTNAGAIVGDGWSVAWRVHDAQFWGVPQRRRRIALVADFGGATAPEILFERKGMFGDITQSGTPWKDFAAAIAKRFGKADRNVDDVLYVDKCYCLQGNGIDRADSAGCNGKGWREDKAYTLNTIDRHAVFDCRGNGGGKTVPTITGDHENRITDYTAVCVSAVVYNGPHISSEVNRSNPQIGDPCHTLSTDSRNYLVTIDRAAFNQGKNAMYNFEVSESGINPTLVAKGPSAVCTNWVRRLTPLECERLQGFPDGWTDIGEYIDTKGKKRKTSDNARFKALGNSIALPYWHHLLSKLIQYTDGTMASLFDGIGGFPLIWETLGGKCLWASEIEEFCIAVTKYRFGDDT